MGYANGEETINKLIQSKLQKQSTIVEEAKHTMLTIINISTYINEKPHTSFENTLTKQKSHL